MAQKIEKNIVQFIRQNDMPLTNRNIVLAVSGGADSVALLHIFHNLVKTKTIDSRLVVAHI
ncbi:MAG: ATP-binding protein, partial [Phycisphaerae bacterium]|nr:ATP-binding protein [Phycisphaerae bacterium]